MTDTEKRIAEIEPDDSLCCEQCGWFGPECTCEEFEANHEANQCDCCHSKPMLAHVADSGSDSALCSDCHEMEAMQVGKIRKLEAELRASQAEVKKWESGYHAAMNAWEAAYAKADTAEDERDAANAKLAEAKEAHAKTHEDALNWAQVAMEARAQLAEAVECIEYAKSNQE